jgi:hypothetical protein
MERVHRSATLGATVTAGTRYAQYLWADSPRS